MTMRSLFHRHITTPDRSGFTLLELLMVVTILSAVAWMSLGLVNNNMDQVRFDDTRNRLETIKRAIIGDTSRTINGQPEIRGYVTDMGILPPNLQALIQQDYCLGFPGIDTAAACATASGTWSDGDATLDQPDYTYDSITRLWIGWNGPYLTAKELLSYAKFRDGWGNANTTAPTNDFGWDVTVTDDFTIQSFGVDGVAGGTGIYEVDYPPATSSTLVEENEYTTTVTTDGVSATVGDGVGHITVDFGTPEPCWGCWDGSTYIGVFDRATCEATTTQYWIPKLGINNEDTCIGDIDHVAPWSPVNGTWLQTTASAEKICLKITYRDKGTLNTYASVDTVAGTPAEPFNLTAESTFTWDGSQQDLDFVFLDNTQLPMGVLSYNIFEYDSTATPHCATTEFQKENTSWSTFTIVPGTSTTPLNWKLQ